MKKTLAYVLALVAVLFAVACAQKEETSGAATASAPATGELKIVATNWKFDQTEYKVKKGETLTVKLESAEGAHAIKIDKIGEIGTNKSKDITFDKAGTYEILCSIPCGTGHATMKAKLIVE